MNHSSDNMQKYPKYKPSNIDWISEIPSHWSLPKLGLKLRGIKDGTHGTHVRVNEGKLLLSCKNIQNNQIIITENESQISLEEHNEITKNGFPQKGDVLLTIVGSIGRSCVFEQDEAISFQRSVCFIRASKDVNSYYLNFQIQASSFQIQLETLTNKSTQGGVYMGEVKEVRITLPPLSEQQAIVAYLDEKTTLIDELIAKKERKIELLKEQRTALINHVVTKGLNAEVTFKDSNIEWIGDIPEHWEVSRVKFIAEIFGRIGYRGYTVEDIVDEGKGAITISPSNIQSDIFTIENVTCISWEKYYQSPEIMIFENDIVLVKTGSTIGKTAIIPSGCPEMTINPQLVVLKNIKIDNKFFYYQTICDYFKHSFEIEQTGSTTPTISQEKINSFPLLNLPLSEQQAIVAYLDEQTALIDKNIELESQKITTLKEYRQSLISNIVTGKIKVI